MSGLVRDARCRIGRSCLAALLVMHLTRREVNRPRSKVPLGLTNGRALPVVKQACRTTSGVVVSVEASKLGARLRPLECCCGVPYGPVIWMCYCTTSLICAAVSYTILLPDLHRVADRGPGRRPAPLRCSAHRAGSLRADAISGRDCADRLVRIPASLTNCECVFSFLTVKAMYAVMSLLDEASLLVKASDNVSTSAGMIPGSKT